MATLKWYTLNHLLYDIAVVLYVTYHSENAYKSSQKRTRTLFKYTLKCTVIESDETISRSRDSRLCRNVYARNRYQISSTKVYSEGNNRSSFPKPSPRVPLRTLHSTRLQILQNKTDEEGEPCRILSNSVRRGKTTFIGVPKGSHVRRKM